MEAVEIYRERDGVALPCGPVAAAIGVFDGVHRGHQALLLRLCEEARARQLRPLVFTFSENPKNVCALSGEPERLEAFASFGVSAVFLADYASLRGLSCEDFVREYLREKLDCRAVVIGSDFRFGRGRSGDCETMRSLFGEGTVVLPPVQLDGQTVSSSEIRRRLQAGDLTGAERMLGRPYSFLLPVSRGRALGRKLGFPTVNQIPPYDRLLPCFGVYASEVLVSGKTYRGVTNVGVKPTVSKDETPLLETHLLGYEGKELYGETLRVSLLRMLREERRFASVDALRAQLEQDIHAVMFENKKGNMGN